MYCTAVKSIYIIYMYAFIIHKKKKTFHHSNYKKKNNYAMPTVNLGTVYRRQNDGF